MSVTDKLASERRGRLAAERMLELKQAELHAANRKLGQHALALSEEIVETRAEVANVRTENERVKSDLTVAHQKIEVAERRLWHSINTIQDGFAFFDSDDCLIAANKAYLVIFDGLEEVCTGVAYARLLQLLTEEGIVNTEGRNRAEWRAWMLDRRQQESVEPVVIRLWNDQFIKMVDHRNPSGDLISLGLNITSTVIYERELKEARKKAEEAARAKSAFLANMSHEIRTPMNGVVGMAELLADTGLDEEQQLFADTIRNSGEALLVIINDILDYSKIEAEKMVLLESQFDFEQTIQEVLMLLQPAASEKGVALVIDYDMFLSRHFMGDVGRVRQILTNLIGNAVKFTLEGHVLVRVLGVPEDNSKETVLHVSIEDTGIGIPKDKIDHIFGDFTQVDDERNRKFEGTGLGLAISQRLINMMHGDVWVTSEEGIGSCFGFRIRLKRVDETPALPPQLSGALSRVMVVDDSQMNRDILVRQMELLGVQTDGFASGTAALEGLCDPFDLIITDHLMPGMDGAEFILEARARGFTGPAIMISSNTSALGDVPARKEFAALLQRPITRDTLVTTLTKLGAHVAQRASEGDSRPADQSAAAPIPEGIAEPPAADATPDAAPEPTSVPMFRARRRGPPPAPEPTPAQAPPTEAPKAAPVALPPVADPPPQAMPPQPAPPPEDHATATPPPASPSSTPPNTPPSTARKMRVLAAEDNKTNQLVFRKMVKHLDIDLTFANNGVEAVERHADFNPDLIFMDISMPRMDGKEATRTIREAERSTGAHVPIVALTAHAMTGDDRAILEAGLDHYLTKPLRKPAIQEMITRYAPDCASPVLVEDAAPVAATATRS